MSRQATKRASRAALIVTVFALATSVLGCGSPTDVAKLKEEADQLIRSGEAHEAATLLRAALLERPDDASLNRLLGIALIRSGQPSLAIWPLRRAADDSSQDVETQALLARAMQRGGDAVGAIDVATRVLDSNPADAAALLIRAQSRMATLKIADAIPDFEALLEIDPQRAEVHLSLIHAHLELDHAQEAASALDALESAVRSSDSPPTPETLAHICARRMAIHQLLDELDQANTLLDECLARHPHQLSVLIAATTFLDAQGTSERATQLFRDAAESKPNDFQIQLALSNRLTSVELHSEAEAVLEATAMNADLAEAWTQLADLRMALKDPRGASQAMESAIEVQRRSRSGKKGGSAPQVDDRLQFVHADLLIGVGEVRRARGLLQSVDEPAYRLLLEARIELEEERYDSALETYERAFQLWHSNPGARYFAAQAALELSRFDDAIRHLRESVRADAGATDAGFLLARIHDAQGDPAAAAGALQIHGGRHPNHADALEMMAGFFSQAELFDQAEAIRAVWAQVPGQQGAVFADRVREVDRREGRSQALALFEGPESPDLADEAHLEALLEWTNLMTSEGHASIARDRVHRLLARRPEAAGLHALLGKLLLREGSISSARASIEQALRLDPDHLSALRDRCLLSLSPSLSERIIDDELGACDRLSQSAPDSPRGIKAQLDAIDRMIEIRATEAASAKLERLLEQYPWRGDAALRLARIRIDANLTDAVTTQYLERARRFPSHREAEVFQTLGRFQVAQGLDREAISSLRRAVELDAEDPTSWFLLGDALERAHLDAEAIAAYERVLEHDTSRLSRTVMARIETLQSRR